MNHTGCRALRTGCGASDAFGSGGHPVRLKAGVALSPLYAPFPGLEVAVPASELRNQPVVSRNDLFELSVRLNG